MVIYYFQKYYNQKDENKGTVEPPNSHICVRSKAVTIWVCVTVWFFVTIWVPGGFRI